MLNITYKISSTIDKSTFVKADVLYKEVREALNEISISLMSGPNENTYIVKDEIQKKLMDFSGFAAERRIELTQQFSEKLIK
jgi:hypothetical protein